MRGRRVLPHSDSEVEPELFQMGADEDFEGLRPDREVGEQVVEPATTGENVILEPNFRPTRATRGGRGVRGRGRGSRRGGLADRHAQLPQEEDGITSGEDEGHGEEPLDGLNTDNVLVGRRRTRSDFEDNGNSNIHPRQQYRSVEHSDDSSSSEEDTSLSESSSTESYPSSSESSEEG